MRSKDVKPKQQYAYVGPGGRNKVRKVTVLAVPPETTRGKIRIRYEEGILEGKVSDVPSQRIRAPWNDRDGTKPKRAAPEPAPVVALRGPWPPRVGDPVRWTTGAVEWTVEAIDEANQQVTISSKIFGRPQSETVPLSELRPTPDRSDLRERQLAALTQHERRAKRRSSTTSLEATRLPRRREIDVIERRRDHDPSVPGIEALIDRLQFTPECLDFYSQRLARHVPRDQLAEALHDELKKKATPFRTRGQREYIRLGIRGRFEVVIYREQVDDEDIVIKGLVLPKRKARAKKPRRRAA